MKAFLEAIRALWGILTEFGAAQAISGAAVSGALTVWSSIKGAQTYELAFVAICTFCFVFVFYNSARLVYREYRQYPDYTAWDRVDSFAVWHVACLWAGQVPYEVITSSKKAYPFLQMLKHDIETGSLKVKGTTHNSPMTCRASRVVLVEYAKSKGENPPFLFSDNR